MKNILKYGLLLLLSGCFFASCEDDLKDSILKEQEGKDENRRKDVTYMLYMIGQNDLSSSLTGNINDLKKGFENTDIDANILVYADISSAPELYLIKKDEKGTVTKNTVKTYPDRYSVDPKIMKEVINYVFTEYPADVRGITFSSHADGSLYTPNTISKRSFGLEGSKKYGMNITDIREALDGCPHVDMIMFDACMMASVETVYELKDNTHYFLAAPNSIPAEGFPYDKTLPHILKMNAEGLSRAAQVYMDYYHGNKVDWDDFVSISLTDATKMDTLALYMDSLFQDTRVQEQVAHVNRDKLQMFEKGYWLYDYGHWVDSIGLGCKYLPEVKRRIDKAVIYKAHSDYASTDDYGSNMLIPVNDKTFCGLNTYVPTIGNYSPEIYQRTFFTTLKWYRDAGFWRAPFYNLYEGEE